MVQGLRIQATFVGLLLALTAVACDRPTATEPAPAEYAPQFATTTGSTLIECPTDTSVSATGTIGLLGGSVSVAGHSISLPIGAVLLPTNITLTVPASNYVEVDITANGLEHFEFEEPVSVTISYDRCTRSNIDKAALSAWYIDSDTKALLENMGGVDDKTARTVTFSTGHLSGFAIAE